MQVNRKIIGRFNIKFIDLLKMQSKASAISFELLNQGRDYAKTILKGLTAGTSHFHAVDYMKNKLKEGNFIEIKEM